MMEMELLKEFEKLYQLQETIAQLSTKDLYDALGTTDTHCINFIGTVQEANGVQISANLGLTRSAISKITTRLEKKGYIQGYKKANNHKEVFYRLTEQGQEIYCKHEKAHNAWLIRDQEFLKTVDEAEKKIMLRVLKDFNHYILEKMEVFKDDN
ncbi:MarR family winged helix-turn-helix transcriptional regulator [Clostridium minihomine]|uniref:MarR family winged helix-turn-helix transcriptional regulator n=1 Tax=Clostridium minihomine TaxID=2045012 RepID=UPI000C76049B|nr:transcriptional regulator [Clostridium minihomine]